MYSITIWQHFQSSVATHLLLVAPALRGRHINHINTTLLGITLITPARGGRNIYHTARCTQRVRFRLIFDMVTSRHTGIQPDSRDTYVSAASNITLTLNVGDLICTAKMMRGYVVPQLEYPSSFGGLYLVLLHVYVL